MSALALMRRHIRLVIVLVLVELALGWMLAHIVVRRVHQIVSRHPDGVRSLFTNGARGVFDLASHHDLPAILRAPAIAIGATVLLYAVAGIAIDSLAASAFTRARPSLRSLGTLIAIDLAALLGYATLCLVGSLSASTVHAVTHAWADSRAADLVTVTAVLPTLAVALLLHVSRDLAIVRATCPSDVLSAVGDAIGRLTRHPRETVGARVIFLMGSAGLLVAGTLASWNVSGTAAALAIVCIAVQQTAAAGRTLLRLQWLAYVAARWQSKTPQTPNT